MEKAKEYNQDVICVRGSDTKPTTDLIEHDRRGDLILAIGTNECTRDAVRHLHVCSRALARSSSVFERMLYGSMAESTRKTSGQWIVDLPEDDPDAFEVWSKICHGRFDEIPDALTVDELFNLTALTHYYDSTRKLAPWTYRWMKSIEIPWAEDEIGLHKLLWISLELGQQQLSTSTARTIVLESSGKIDQEDLLQELSSVPMSDTITRLHSIRLQTIASMLQLFRDMSDILVVVDEKPRWCRHASYMGPHRCEAMILGSIVFCLTRAGLWPIPQAEEVKESVLGLFQKLTSIVVHDIGQQEKKGLDHRDCNPRQFLIERLQRILAEIPEALVEVERAS